MTIANRVHFIQQRIDDAVLTYHRQPNSVRLVAVSKGQPASALRQAFDAGVVDFAENKWQEAQNKIASLHKLPITWHFIGPIQSNKTQEIAENFTWVHSVSREKIARLLSKYRPSQLPPLNICIQINLDSEASKSGIVVEELSELIVIINQLPKLKLRGLMTIPKPCLEEKQQFESLLRLSTLLEHANQHLPCFLDTLSMGMSDDFIPAIAAGSTIVRIGRAIFG